LTSTLPEKFEGEKLLQLIPVLPVIVRCRKKCTQSILVFS